MSTRGVEGGAAIPIKGACLLFHDPGQPVDQPAGQPHLCGSPVFAVRMGRRSVKTQRWLARNRSPEVIVPPEDLVRGPSR